MKDSTWFREKTLEIEEARIELERHEKTRAGCYCEKSEVPPPKPDQIDPFVAYFDPDPKEPGEPCWKLIYDDGESYEGQWIHPRGFAPYRDPEEWCDTCRRRQVHHEEVVRIRRLVGIMRATLTREARRIVRAGG